ncbi:hypothetical protein C8Q76DRAFT_758014 [Earliella scabrosa]|nr:hypothetical protein C8Q76DRAFT_758014 [Earliella scabrosa]
MHTAQSIPPELWKGIITLACTDGGYTGRSLALTSKFLHAQSHPWRFHSVALDSLIYLEDILKLLRQAQDESVPAQPRPTIEHLYLSFMHEICRLPPNFWKICRRMSDQEIQEHEQRVASDKQAWDARFIAAMTEILAIAGPTLRTLCILEDPAVRFPPFECGVLPRLEELTLHGHVLPLLPVVPVPRRGQPPIELPPDSWAKLPALRRLHFVYMWGRNLWCGEAVNSIAQLAPSNFTHLRLSNVQRAVLLPALSRALGVPFVAGDGVAVATGIDGSIPSKLRRVKRLITQGYSPAPGGLCGNPYIDWDGFCNDLEAFAQECERARGIRMLHLSRPWRRNCRWKERLRDDWLDRIEGRDGCWVQSEVEEAGREVYEDDPASLDEEDDW